MAYIQTYSSSKKKCNRKYMEDYFNIHFCFENQCWIFNICDGHGGFEVAEYINKNFNHRVIEKLDGLKKKKIKKDQFKSLIHEVIDSLDKDVEKMPWADYTGSTLAAVIYYNGSLFLVNVGDSIIICNMHIPYFNKLHVPTDKEERTRINKSSFIENDRIEGVINLSRALGDFRFKQKDKSRSPMISTPDIDSIEIKKLYEFNSKPWIFLSSDGLLILFSRSEIRRIINVYFEFGYSCDEIVKVLTDYCTYFHNDDNIAIILIFLEQVNPKTTLEKRKKRSILTSVKQKIKQFCLEGLKQAKPVNWKLLLSIIKEEVLIDFRSHSELQYIYKLLEFEVISFFPQIQLDKKR